jgi:hypothetical protein
MYAEASLKLAAVDKDLPMRYPGVFLHKKAEKFGKDKKRFFQLEKAADSEAGCQFVYYTGVPPAEQKGTIVVGPATEVETKGKDIVITNTDRAWSLAAKTEEEAQWWCNLLRGSKQGLPDHACQEP